MTEQEIFIKAMECQSLEERTHFLDEACSGDPQLRERVESLIRQSGQLGSFLEHPAVEGISSPEIESPSEVHVAATIEHDDSSAADESDETFGAETMISDTQDDGDEIPLGYLQPSDKPDSLGRLGHYEVLEVVGRGAFGTVLRAFDEKLQRVVAIKVLSPEMASTSPARKRFLREARSSAAVRHENVVAIYAVEDEPIPYLVMEYIPGKTLQQRLKEQGPLDFIDVLRLGKQIADGLAAAHAEGLIHRDIKPGNILLEGGMNDRVKITDFGLARTADDASMTQSGVIAGTPLYMAPEQAQGQKLDQRADLFSLGSVLYQMLSGRPPFRAPTTMAVLKRVVDDEPRPIQEIIPEVPDWLCELIGHLHAKDRDSRYSTAQEVSQLLQQSIDDLNASRHPQIPSPVEVRDGSQSTSNVSSSKKQQPRKSKAKDPNQPKKSVPAWAPILAVLVGASAFFLAPRISRWMQTPIPDLPETEVQAGLKFDGRDDWVQISGLDWQYPQFTIEAFVTSAPNSDNGTIAFLSSSDQDAKEWMSLFDGGPAEPGKRISGAAAKGKTLYENAYGPFAPGKRQHRALVYDGYKLSYYINGVWQGERRAEPHEGLEWNMHQLNIGCNGQRRQFFQGVVDQLQISRVARYEDNFTAPTQLESDERTLAFYKFDEGRGDVLTDASGNGHDGKIVGATWVKLGQVQSESPSDLQLVAAGAPVNLIALIDPARDFRDDRLKVQDGKLITPKFRKDLQPAGSVGLIPYTQIPDNYDIKLQLERVSEHYSGFNIGLLVDGNHVAVGMDSGFNTKVWGLDFLDGLPAHRPENDTSNPGRRLEIGKNTDVTIEVRKNHIRAICNGETIVDWQGDPNRLSVFDGFKIAKTDGLFFVAQADFIVHKMELIPYQVLEKQTEFNWSDVWPKDAPAIAPFDADQAKAHQEAWAKYLDVPVEYENSIGMKFRLIPPGEFMMGSTPEEIEEALKVAGKDEDWRENINSEAPLHKVILTQPLYVGVTEVTQTQYEQIVGTNPSHFAATGKGKDKVANLETGNHPVEMVNWNDAAGFCAKLSQQEQLKPFYFRSGETVTSLDGTGYRLPTEAEWEYFCRAGTTTRFWSGDEEKDLVSAGWFGHNSGSRTHAAGELKSNPFGLSDVHGNVWEWVQDSWNRTFHQKFEEDAAVDPTAPISRNSPHMIRSGYWLDVPAKCRSSIRYGTYGWLRDHHIGFRVVLLVDAVKQSNQQQN